MTLASPVSIPLVSVRIASARTGPAASVYPAAAAADALMKPRRDSSAILMSPAMSDATRVLGVHRSAPSLDMRSVCAEHFGVAQFGSVGSGASPTKPTSRSRDVIFLELVGSDFTRRWRARPCFADLARVRLVWRGLRTFGSTSEAGSVTLGGSTVASGFALSTTSLSWLCFRLFRRLPSPTEPPSGVVSSDRLAAHRARLA